MPRIKDIHDWFDTQRTIKAVEKKHPEKLSIALDVCNMRNANDMALRGGVNSCGEEKLAQYEVHERLHRAYESNRLKKTLLSYFLLVTAKDRHILLKWMGSDFAPSSITMPNKDDLPSIWLRLAKVPPSYSILGDKGFYLADRLNPNINHVRTPWKLSNEEVQEYKRSAGMIKEDRETSDTRVVVEDGYERYRNETVLKGTVSYWEIALLPYANEWGHAVINLSRPIRFPGDKSCFINSDIYWCNNT